MLIAYFCSFWESERKPTFFAFRRRVCFKTLKIIFLRLNTLYLLSEQFVLYQSYHNFQTKFSSDFVIDLFYSPVAPPELFEKLKKLFLKDTRKSLDEQVIQFQFDQNKIAKNRVSKKNEKNIHLVKKKKGREDEIRTELMVTTGFSLSFRMKDGDARG